MIIKQVMLMRCPISSLFPPVWLAILLCPAFIGLASAQPGGDGNQPGVKRALLIGINKYKAVPKLQGSLNDIETMRQILVTRWGFLEKNIVMVTDEAATRAGMLAALKRLVKDAGPNDTVYFHYSGHGSQVEDTNGDEVDDGLDETLVPQDGRSGDVRDITDDELDALFSRMKAVAALIVLDSCHSGTATRSLDIRTRSIPRDTRVELYRKAEAEQAKTRGIVPLITSRYVVMTGAAAHQEALDGPVDGRYHGFFTYSLARSLGTASPDATARQVFSGVERELKRIQTHFGRPSMPEPQLEAPPELLERTLLRATVFTPGAPALTPRLPWVIVQPGDTGRITLINGSLLGAAPGSVWSLYPPGDTQFLPGHALAAATVTHVAGKDAIAKLLSPHTKIPPESRAVLLLSAPTGNRIPIRLLNVPEARQKSIGDTIKLHLKDADIVGTETPARFLLEIQEQSLRLLTADGLQVLATFGLGESWGNGLAAVLSRSIHASELLSLDNPTSQLQLHVRVANTPTRRVLVNSRGIAVVSADTHPAYYRIRRTGEERSPQNSLQLEVRVNADSYVTIVDVDSEGGVNLLFPNPYQKADFHQEGFLLADEMLLVPDSLQPGNRAGFYWDYGPPQGIDTIRVFATADLETARMIRERVTGIYAAASRTRGIGGAAHSQTVSAAFRQLRRALSSRGIITVYDPTTHVPGEVASAAEQPPGEPHPGPAEFETPPPATYAPEHFLSGSDGATYQSSAIPSDWTATSVTVMIAD
jgi:hypothetical protein